MSSETERPGNEGLKEFRGPEPTKATEDLPPTPPVADDDGALSPVADVKVAGVEEAKQADPPPPPAPKLSPFDAKRAKIAERFAPKRMAENTESDLDFAKNENVYGKLAGSGDPPPADAPVKDDVIEAPAKPGPSDSEAKPETITLVVNGKTMGKTLAEIAALADMTEDEVKADPTRAKRYAQKELAAEDNLERSRRATPARQQDDADARAARPDPNQDRREAGNDGRDQPPVSRNTSDEDLEKLIEDIQIGNPKDVAPKLAEVLDKIAESKVNKTKGDDLRRDELNSNISAVADFLKDHPELEGKNSVAAAISGKLDEEYRADLRAALIQEGDSEQAADELLSKANRDDIRNAHLARRLNRNPHVRKIDKAMMESVYEKVRADFGVTGQAPQQQQQQLSRQDRKEVLPTQPRRASVPPATPPAPPAPISRKAAVAEMASRTGRKVASLNR
jgi:hypothetical protein